MKTYTIFKQPQLALKASKIFFLKHWTAAHPRKAAFSAATGTGSALCCSFRSGFLRNESVKELMARWSRHRISVQLLPNLCFSHCGQQAAGQREEEVCKQQPVQSHQWKLPESALLCLSVYDTHVFFPLKWREFDVTLRMAHKEAPLYWNN